MSDAWPAQSFSHQRRRTLAGDPAPERLRHAVDRSACCKPATCRSAGPGQLTVAGVMARPAPLAGGNGAAYFCRLTVLTRLCSCCLSAAWPPTRRNCTRLWMKMASCV